jgi:hypothetical protein
MDNLKCKLSVTVTRPAVLKCPEGANCCPTCAGFGLKVRRTNRRRNGAISSVVLDGKVPCPSCAGTGMVQP